MDSLPVVDLKNTRTLPEDFVLPVQVKSPLVKTTNRMIQGKDTELLIKIYEPVKKPETSLPAFLWIHGGGYLMGHPDLDDSLCEQFVLRANCVVGSIDYRLAPDHAYPAAIEDCYAGLTWMAEHADELQIDPARLAIGGASAGGGLTAALAILARDRGGPNIVFQMPLYPMIDDRNRTPSSHEINQNNFPKAWNREMNQLAWSMYLGSAADGDVPSYAAAARETDLSGLPPAYTCIGDLDLFRDETIDYVARLAQADVPVEFHLYPGCFHGFDVIFNDAEISNRARNEYIDALYRALNP
ncbi:alpha/beta hydrolase [Cohnella sp. F6_2S_P_1]|uniref:Alpha/beta hydrolase n=2 Tax=Cohnella hashimotonis TaxID=2826895 RepID=A0ABT6TEH5_9BACL|nr:alpha/beta hydrolase [Cohnella hashimotonis]MDI4645164.1 alpha/beta hydrolase [Cohnella hashimotonis]